MTTTVITTVRCASDNASDVPESFAIELTDAMKARIKELAATVKSLGVLCIREFNFDGIWSESDSDDLKEQIEEARRQEICADTLVNSCDVENPIIAVYDNRFHFTSVPKHFDDDCLLITQTIKIDDLEDNNYLIRA